MSGKEMIIKKEADFILHTYSRPPFVLDHGLGAYLIDTDGRTYLDFTAGIAVNALGHGDSAFLDAIQAQCARMGHVSNLYYSAPQVILAEKLCMGSFADKVFFTNSGAESVEAAIKIARKKAFTANEPEKHEIVSFSGSFHGRTMGALALTAREKYQKPFRPLMAGAVTAPFNDLAAAADIISDHTCAIIVEPIQGEGGIIPADQGFLEGLRMLADRHDAMLIFDEIQCGMGRTGTLWAYQQYDVTPDMLTTAKALGGGLPIGAVLMTDDAATCIEPGDHGSTFAGGPIACAAALAVLARVDTPEMLVHIQKMGDMLVTKLAEARFSSISQIRGRGLMIGLEININAGEVVKRAAEEGLLLVNAGEHVIRLLPPYIITESEIDQCINILKKILS